MRVLTLLLLPAVLSAGPSRIARLGEFQGKVEVQLTAADPWMAAERNLPLGESAWLRTGTDARVEIELDDGAAWRLGPNSQGEISDYTRLSTGQRITVLSLDHGTAYFTGEPRGKDVLMVTMPGAEAIVLEGSRIRQTATAAWSQVAVMEGHVRFSSQSAELDVREGKSIRVEPANASRFALFPEVVAEPLDRWSEERDKLEATPKSGAYVSALFGLTDLDSAGQWISTEDLGTVWKPDVEQDWVPFRNGRWRYLDTLGFTWVSDDPWGWLPYHNGRWSRKEKLGWVWQPSATTVFHPGEVYWLRGDGFTAWGPLAPGEHWDAPAPGAVLPQAYSSRLVTYAGLKAESRTIDGAGFPAPTAEQMKTAIFVPALPSPAFLTARLDAIRPTLNVGRTRVMPSVPGVTFGDALPCPPMPSATDYPPAAASTPPIADIGGGGGGSLPDGVYPVPAVAVPIIEVPVPVIVNGPIHPDYSRQPGGGGRNGGQATGNSGGQTTTTPASSGSAITPVPPPASRPIQRPLPTPMPGRGPEPPHPPQLPPAATSATPAPTVPDRRPVPPPETGRRPEPARPPQNPPAAAPAAPASRPEPSRPQPATPPASKSDPVKKQIAALPEEMEFHRQVLKDINPASPNFKKALADLNEWSKAFPKSASPNDRLYYYTLVYNAIGLPAEVLNSASALVQSGVRNSFGDEQQVLQVLVAVSSNLQKIPIPTRAQLTVGQKAARELLDFLPAYFTPPHKPSKVTESEWSLTRVQLEGVARDTLTRKRATAD